MILTGGIILIIIIVTYLLIDYVVEKEKYRARHMPPFTTTIIRTQNGKKERRINK